MVWHTYLGYYDKVVRSNQRLALGFSQGRYNPWHVPDLFHNFA